jgi:hypothetical protein
MTSGLVRGRRVGAGFIGAHHPGICTKIQRPNPVGMIKPMPTLLNACALFELIALAPFFMGSGRAPSLDRKSIFS